MKIHPDFLPITPVYIYRRKRGSTFCAVYRHHTLSDLYANHDWYYDAGTDTFIHPDRIVSYANSMAVMKMFEGK